MIQVGDTLPDGILYHIDPVTRILHVLSIRQLFSRKRVLLLGVAGAFTPACSIEHIPGYITKAPQLKAKGITDIYCMTVNDAFVTHEWSKRYPHNDSIRFMADGSGTFTKALGMETELSRFDMGTRCRRFVMFADNLVVRKLVVEYLGEQADISVDDVLKLFI